MADITRARTHVEGTTLLTVVVVVAVLYFAHVVLIPLALAVLVAFMLAPISVRLRHLGIGRIPSAFIVVLFSFLLVSVIGFTLTSQLSDLAQKLPEYQQNVRTKLDSLRESGGGLVTRISRVAETITETLTPPPAARPNEQKPVPVEIRTGPFSPIEAVQKVLGSALTVLLTSAIVVVFVIFILVQREDLRDRLIRLAGERRINVTTRLLDDAAHRVSRYLLAQLGINVVFGCLAAIGVYFLGVPNPVLWGILAALLRYVPYLGIWVAATLPAAVVFAVEPGWAKVPGVFALYFGIDLLMYNIAEPLLYGNSTGISPMAILVAAVFWTWLWGPVGLLLSTPLTVCVVVLGRHVPRLSFLSIALSDEEVLTPDMRFYQRLLAMDVDEATEIAEAFLKGKSLEALYDQVLIPALSLAEEERHRGHLDEKRQSFVFQNTRLLMEDVAERERELVGHGRRVRSPLVRQTPEAHPATKQGEPAVICVPARDDADELAALMLAQLLEKRGIQATTLPVGALASEHLEQLHRRGCKVVCICCVPPFGYTHARYLSRRIRSELHDVKIVAGILTEADVQEIKNRQPALSADEIVSTLKDALGAVLSWLPVASEKKGEPVLTSA